MGYGGIDPLKFIFSLPQFHGTPVKYNFAKGVAYMSIHTLMATVPPATVFRIYVFIQQFQYGFLNEFQR